MLTIFSTPKPFKGKFKIIQRNAITSWTKLWPQCEIILFGQEEGTAEICRALNLIHVPKVKTNEYGTPLLNDMFEQAQRMASNYLMCYVNADIILLSNFVRAILAINKRRFLAIGQRLNVDIDWEIDFSKANWDEELLQYALKNGRWLQPTGMDFFVFNKGLYQKLPGLAIGRTWWDPFLVYQAKIQCVPIVDITQESPVIHCNHDYSHHPQGYKGIWEGPESEHNRCLCMGKCLNITNADWKVKDGKLVSVWR
ncbi:MAG: hypothetical protein LWW94_10435 [Candidatus Desulfofervidaceae bacterium]|nr:hypothetical protein [Candidatus Desulfofervidaceae bacterium]